MKLDRRFWRLSPQEVDPLTWLTGPLVPLVLGGLIVVYGGIFAATTWGSSPNPILQLAGVALCALACAVVHILTRPLRPRLGWLGAIAALSIALVGFTFSAVGFAGSMVTIELWWAPFGLALVIASLAPYLPARALVVVGGGSMAIAGPIGYLFVHDQVPNWGPISTALIILSPPISAVLAGAAFSIAVVGRLLPLIEARSQTMLTIDAPRDAAAHLAERERVESLTARAAPFIEQVALAGVVTPADRSLAGQLARQLRDDLVTQSNLSWLDTLANGSRIVVVDPDRRASRMRAAQRTALRGLLRAILDLPGMDAGSLLVELRATADGATAVAVSGDVELPEGRRMMHLAPYYLALKGAVEDLEWSNDRMLRVTFSLDS